MSIRSNAKPWHEWNQRNKLRRAQAEFSRTGARNKHKRRDSLGWWSASNMMMKMVTMTMMMLKIVRPRYQDAHDGDEDADDNNNG